MNTFTHNGIEIALNGVGEFWAVIDGKREKAPSLAAMKKRIDSRDTFKPFDALILSYKDEIKQIRVIGITKPSGKRTYSNRPKFIGSDTYHHDRVYPLEARDTILEWQRVCEESERIRSERSKIDDAAAEKICAITAFDYAKQGKP